MPQYGQKLIPIGTDFDSSELYIKSDKAYFLKGLNMGWTGDGQNEFELKPLEGNYLYSSIKLPDGENICIGSLEYTEAKEVYIVVFNSYGKHLIYRIKAATDTAEIVYNFCEGFEGITDNPKYFFGEGRISLKSICKYLEDGTKQLYKELYLVNTQVNNIRIVVEDSIATNSFSTPFFTSKNNCCLNKCSIISVGVEVPNEKISFEVIPVTEANKKQNRLTKRQFKFRFKYENAWGQPSEHGIVSDSFSVSGFGCSSDNLFLPSCIWIKQKLPCPQITKVILEFSECTLNSAIGNDADIFSDWKVYTTINLYDQTNSELNWYERHYDLQNKDFKISTDKKELSVKFCNDKECVLIAKSDIRDQNPAPKKSGSVSLLGAGLAFGANEYGFNKFPKKDLEGISYELVKQTACEVKYSNVKVYAVIVNMQGDGFSQPVYRRESGDSKWVFGGYHFNQAGNRNSGFVVENFVGDPEASFSDTGGSGQYFPEGVKGFRGSLSNGQIVESKQYLAKGTDELVLSELVGGTVEVKDYLRDNVKNGTILIQEFDFGRVQLGKYYFRIHGHSDTEDLINTSTFYIHTTNYEDYKQSGTIVRNFTKEILVDNTDGLDYSSIKKDKIAVISDVSNIKGTPTNVIRGYVYEGIENKIPVTMAKVIAQSPVTSTYSSKLTDHNGFFFAVSIQQQTNEDLKVKILGISNCAADQEFGHTPTKKKRGTAKAPDILVVSKIATFITNQCNRHYVTGKVKECNSNSGISGVPVTVAGARTVYTNGSGEFSSVLHYSNERISDLVIISPPSLCLMISCVDCQPINFSQTVTHPVCQLPCVGSVIKNLGVFKLRSISSRGLEHGGRFAAGIAGYDGIRRSDIQALEDWFIDIPTEAETGSADFYKIKVKLPKTFSPAVCSQFKTLIFSLSKNLNSSTFLTWAADKVEFIDSAGNANQSSPTKIKIWYRSLNEYNRLGGFNTNSVWSFVDSKNNTVLGDTVEFIQNVDGTYLPGNFEATVQHDKEGNYFLIDYDSKFARLKDGVKFKLKRPFACEEKTLYFEYHFPLSLCADCSPRDSEGNLVTEFILDAVDSYYLPRQIPVVTDVVEIVPASDGKTQEKKTRVVQAKTYPFQFEHHSPSDSWGFKCNNLGRINARNEYEGKKCDRNQILVTGAINTANDGAINYLHYFSFNEEFVIEEQNWGGIIAMITRDDGQIMLICEQAVFSLAYNDNRATVSADGYIVVPTSKRFSRPERNGSFNYGCQPNEINTIRRRGSLVIFLDAQRNALVIHDFQNATNISEGAQSWLTNSIKEVNKVEKFYWHGVFDNRRNKYILTKVNLETKKFTNNLEKLDYAANESLSYDFINKSFECQLHYTPEYYASLFGDSEDSQLFSFKKGLPYRHYSTADKVPYLNYFGEQCTPMIGVVTNDDNTKLKSFLYNEVYCKEVIFIAKLVQTQMEQISEIPIGQWEIGEGLSVAPYLCDIANQDKCDETKEDLLMDGDTLYGRWLKTLYLVPDYKGIFFKLTAIMSYYFRREKSSDK